MKIELQKRIITSIFLISLVSLCLYLGGLAIVIALFIVSYITYSEFSGLLDITYKYSASQHLLRHGMIIFYCFFIFFLSSLALTINNVYDFIFVISICIFSDVGGYIVGKIIKGPKLTKISPNKTISGTIGSFIFSTFPLVIFSQIDIELYSLNYKNLIFCLLVSLVSQAGDLFVSFLKRKAKIKDTGKIVYGHGGILDRMDGIIFAVPFVCIYLHGFEHINFFDYFFK